MTGTAEQIIAFLLPQTKSGEVFDISLHKEKRSLSQNAYYWVLLDKVASAVRISKPGLHNRMMRQYGAIQTVTGSPIGVFLPDTEKAENEALEAATYHLRPTAVIKIGANGKALRQYLLLKGSHELNTQEMSVLMDGLIQEAKNLGIETATPEELQRMRIYDLQKQAKQND